jgi:hypothetical protein
MTSRPCEVPEAIVKAIELGERQTSNLAELFAADLSKPLLTTGVITCPRSLARIRAERGRVHRFRVAGEELALSKDRSALRRLATHQSDLIRGVVAFALAASEVAQLSTQLDHIRPLARGLAFPSSRVGMVGSPRYHYSRWGTRANATGKLGFERQSLSPSLRDRGDATNKCMGKALRPAQESSMEGRPASRHRRSRRTPLRPDGSRQLDE